MVATYSSVHFDSYLSLCGKNLLCLLDKVDMQMILITCMETCGKESTSKK